jgi:hypothetical protein
MEGDCRGPEATRVLQNTLAKRRPLGGVNCFGLPLTVRSLALWLAFGVCWAAYRSTPAHAGSFLQSIGEAFGAPVGGFIEAATVPAVQGVQGAANQVIGNLDSRVDTEIKNAGTTVDAAIAQAQSAGSGLLGDANSMMAARIAQVKVGADQVIQQAIGSIDAEQRQIFEHAGKLVQQIDTTASNLLQQADQIISKDLTQANGVVQNAIAQANEDAQARIDQVDQAASRQVGSIDAVASKQTLSVQVALLQVASFAGMIGFLAAALVYLFKHVPAAAKDLDRRHVTGLSRHARLVGSSLGWLLVHLGVGAAAVAGFSLLANLLPRNAKAQAEALTQAHQQGLDTSLHALDFTMVKYHATLLAILDPTQSSQDRALELRVALMRDVLTRPELLGEANGIRKVSAQLQEAGLAQDAVTPGKDSADLLTVAAHVRWQLAKTRTDELDAVSLCGRALELGKADDQAVLGPLAAHYILAFLARPITWTTSATHPYDAAALSALATATPQTSPLTADAQAYDNLVLALDAASSAAFVDMLNAQAEVETAWGALSTKEYAGNTFKASTGEPSPGQVAVQKALDHRATAAKGVIAAWSTFDHALTSTDGLAANPLTMAVFGLNDAPISEAWWYLTNPAVRDRARAIEASGDAVTRARLLPIRVSWARRYLTPLRQGTKQLASYEESDRFRTNETRTLAFANAFIDYRVAAASPGASNVAAKRSAAAVAASNLGLYVGGVAYGSTLLGETGPGPAPDGPTRAAVEAANEKTRLRLL